MSGVALTLVVALLAPDGGTPATKPPAPTEAPAEAPTEAPGEAAGEAPAPDPEPAGPPPAKGPAPAAKIECVPIPVQIGQPLTCTLTAVHPADVKVEVPLPDTLTQGGSQYGPLADKAANRSKTETLPDGRVKTTRVFQTATYEALDLQVPALPLKWTEPGGGVGQTTVEGPRVPVTLITGATANADFRTFAAPLGERSAEQAIEGEVNEDATQDGESKAAIDAFWAHHGPVPHRVTNWPLIIALIVLGAGALGFGIAWIVRRWMDNREVEEVPWVDPRPAHVIALEALEALAHEDLPGQGLTKAFYFRLSEIVRTYLERRFGFNALEMTSDEIRAWLPGLSLGLHAHRAVEDFLSETDLVKFAGFAPSEEAVETVMRAARGIVELTRAPDEPASDAAPTEEA